MNLTHGRIWTLTWIFSAGLIAFAACSNETLTEDDGGGGSGAGTTSPGGGGAGTGTETGTSSGTTTGTPSGTAAGTPGGTETGTPSGTSAGTPTGSGPCEGCGDYLQDPAVMTADLCGYISEDANGNLTCDPNSSCSFLADLVTCTCGTCANDCANNTCAGLDPSNDCLVCVTTSCLNEFNTCSGDVM